MPAKDRKRENFDVTPEQEAEIDHFQHLVKASTRKDAVLTAVRLALHLACEARDGYQIFVGNEKRGEYRRVIVPGVEPPPMKWKYLVERPHSWKSQLFVKGRRLPAANVWSSMLVEKMSIEETAEDWDLPVEAIEEIISYCEANKSLIEMEAAEERQWLEERGISIDPKTSSR
ncbi:MAG: hypothetical protein K2Y22_15790 [Candidatus Obscuribacterales bacterium]|nr:hypothetical protein [Candidatus Obscuribacterales bacterium]